MPSSLPTRFGVQLPDWVTSELADVPDTMPTDEDRVRLVKRLAARNTREGRSHRRPEDCGQRPDVVVHNARGRGSLRSEP
ncbi:hypothetical protein [Streptomyces sp. NPDC002172]